MCKSVGLVLSFVGVFILRGATQEVPCPSDRGGKALPHELTHVFLYADQAQYALSQLLVVDVGINDGPDPVYIYGRIAWGYGGGLVLRLRDQSGKEVAPILRDDTMLPPPSRNDDPSMFVKLIENKFFGTRREIPVPDLTKTPGKYSLQVEYRSPLFCGFVDPKLRRLPALWHEDAGILSNVVSFEVTP